MSDSGGLSDSSKESPPPSSNQTSPPPSSNQTSPPIDNSPPSGGGSSNSAPPPTSHSSSAPPPEAHSSSSSPPAPHSSSAPPLSSNPISPPAPATSQNSSSPPPPQLSSPPPFNSTLPTPSPPPNSPPPESPKSSPPSISTPSPPATQNFSLPPPSPSYSPPPPAEKSPPPPETPPSSGGGGTSSPSPPPAEFAPPPPVRFSSPPALEVSKSLPPQVALSPPAIASPDKATGSSSSLQPPSSFTPKSSSSTPSLLSPRSSEQSDSGKGISHVTIAAVTVTGVAIIALVAVVLLVLKRRKRKDVPYNTQYKPSNNYTAKSDGYYYGPQPNTGNSAQMDPFYGSHPTHSPTGLGNTYGNPQGQGYPLGGYDSSGGIGGSKSFFTYEEMMTITNGFSRQNIIGEGGFGCVYKGLLTDGKPVAVKQLKAGSGQGEREFQAEVDIISRVHHRHLVTLVGYCISEHHRLLIYEFVPNKTLEHHLHGKELPLLDWAKRVKIALGAARGLAYLHEDCHPKIIHRDIKSANILLDDSFEAKVADFGLAKLNIDANTHVSTRVMGTFGYMAPEYAASGKLTDRSDVFSFGVVLLELITGRKPIDSTQPLGDESLVEWARPLLNIALQSGDFSQLLDPRLEKMYVEREVHKMIDVAAACVRHSALKRPRMVQVVRSLDSEGDIHDLSNGMKYGQSTAYDSAQYSQDIRNFRRTVFGSTDDSEFDAYPSGDYSTREHKVGAWGSEDNSSEFTSRDSETRAIKSSEARLGTDNYEGSRPAA